MTAQPDEFDLTFHERLYAIMQWERRCAQADLQQIARHGDRWLHEELARVARTAAAGAAVGRQSGRRYSVITPTRGRRR